MAKSLIGEKRFLPYFCTQFLGAFNDNIYRNAFAILITYFLTKEDNEGVIVNAALVAFILPFFLFGAIAGQLADKFEKHINRSIDCAMFNFGYLPKADKSITTVAETSVFALNSTLRNLCDTGLICMICYPGHTEGTTETHSIQKWLTALNTSSYCITKFDSNHPNQTTPILYTVSIKS